jgi:sulfate permease, SulP family
VFNLQNYKNSNIKNDVLSGIVVAVALVPEAIAFAFIAGVSPLVGLYAAFILGLITAILGGKPGMISGATGAVAVVFVGLGLKVNEMYASAGLSSAAMSEMILQYILVASILAGIIQITIGALKMGKFIRLVPQPAMYGFVNGLAIVIASAQFKFFEGEGAIMYGLVIITMVIMNFMPKVTKIIPSGLAAIIFITVVVYFGGLETKTVGDLADISGSLPSFHVPTMPWTTETFMTVLPYAILVALVGLIESLLTLSVLDEMGGERGHGNKECIAQGVGNVTCGSFGAMAGCAMIGQSIINYSSGGLGRLSGITAAILLISFVVALNDLISIIPVAVLVGIMFMVSIGTFEWSSLNRLKKMPTSDAFVVLAVTIITVMFDLAVAVIFGVIISALVFAWKHAKLHAYMSKEEDGTTLYSLEGPLFFGSVTSFGEQFDVENDGERVVIDFKNSRVMDISGVEAIDAVTKKYRKAGKEIHLRHLSADCKSILKEAGEFCDFQEDDPTYKVAYDY